VPARRRAVSSALVRLVLAGVFLLAPVVSVAVPMLLSIDNAPDAARSKRILSRLPPNVYRAFEFPTESTAYDRLALSALHQPRSALRPLPGRKGSGELVRCPRPGDSSRPGRAERQSLEGWR